LAIDKSELNAKRALADRLGSLISSKLKTFTSETGVGGDVAVIGEVDRVTTNLITEVNVAGYKRIKSKIISEGKTFRSYVLLRYPLGEANKIVIDQIKRSKLLDAKLRASQGFKELEKEVQRARKESRGT